MSHLLASVLGGVAGSLLVRLSTHVYRRVVTRSPRWGARFGDAERNAVQIGGSK